MSTIHYEVSRELSEADLEIISGGQPNTQQNTAGFTVVIGFTETLAESGNGTGTVNGQAGVWVEKYSL